MRKIKLPNIHKNTWFIQWFSQGLGFVCALGKRWHWGYVTPPSNTHALEVSPHGTWFSISHKTLSHLRQASWMCHVLARWESHLFVRQKQSVCLFGLVGLTVSPVKATLQLSLFEKKMGTNLHLINPTSPPSSSWKTPLSPPPPPL